MTTTTHRDRIENLDGFWTRQFAYYLAEHRHPLNRLSHMVGIPLLLGTLLAAVLLRSWGMFIGGQAVGWIVQVIGHRIEGNKPALLKRPVAFLMGPLMVLVEMLEYAGIQFDFAKRARSVLSH